MKAARRAALARQGPGGKLAVVCAAPFAPPFQDTLSLNLFLLQRLPALSRDEQPARMAACEVADDNARPIAAHTP